MAETNTVTLLNPELRWDEVIEHIIFFGEKINSGIVTFLNKYLPLTSTQNSILLTIIYSAGIYVALSFLSSLKKPIKWIIVGLFVFLIVGFFKPI